MAADRMGFNSPILISAIISLASAGAAVSQTPDTLDWRRYFPIEIGNEWQFRAEDPGATNYRRWHIYGDTLLDQKWYYNMSVENLDGGYELRSANVWQIRYDTVNANVVARTETVHGGYIDTWIQQIPCGLDAPFGGRNECRGTLSGMDYFVYGEYETSYVIGMDAVEVDALKVFDSLVGRSTLVADIGLIDDVVDGDSPAIELVYANVGGKRYGEAAVPTAVEQPRGLDPAPVILAIYPNSFSAKASVIVQVPAPGPVYIEVFDLLGRPVLRYQEHPRFAGESRTVIDGARLAAGTYLVRLTAPLFGQDTHVLVLAR